MSSKDSPEGPAGGATPSGLGASGAEETEALAAAWCARRDGDRWNDGDEQAFERWLSASIANRVAYLRISQGWRRADRLVALKRPRRRGGPRETTYGASGAFLRKSHFGSIPQRLAAGLALAGLAGLLWLVVPRAPTGVEYATPVGGREVVALADGSRLTLNTDSQIHSAIEPASRTVWLDRGEVFFNVAHDSAHPFVVLAGGQRITVLGTRFSVRRQGDQVAVLVEEGRVKVETSASAMRPRQSTVVTRNDAVVAGVAELTVSRKTPEQVEGALRWRDGKIDLDHLTLGEAVAEFNRYNATKLVILDAQAAQTRIGGTFDVENVRGFAELLRTGFDLKVSEKEREITISR